MIYVLFAVLGTLFMAAGSIALFLWGLGGLVNARAAVEVDDEET